MGRWCTCLARNARARWVMLYACKVYTIGDYCNTGADGIPPSVL